MGKRNFSNSCLVVIIRISVCVPKGKQLYCKTDIIGAFHRYFGVYYSFCRVHKLLKVVDQKNVIHHVHLVVFVIVGDDGTISYVPHVVSCDRYRRKIIDRVA